VLVTVSEQHFQIINLGLLVLGNPKAQIASGLA